MKERIKKYITIGVNCILLGTIGFYIGESYGIKQGKEDILSSLKTLQNHVYERNNKSKTPEEALQFYYFGNNINKIIEILEFENINSLDSELKKREFKRKIHALEENLLNQGLYLKQKYLEDFLFDKYK